MQGVEQRCGQAAVDGAGWIAVRGGRLGRDGHVAARGLDDVYPSVSAMLFSGRRAGDEPLHELQAAHRPCWSTLTGTP